MDVKLSARLHCYRDWFRLKTLCRGKYSDGGQRLKQRKMTKLYEELLNVYPLPDTIIFMK